jgi:hypothetical protein
LITEKGASLWITESNSRWEKAFGLTKTAKEN